AAAWWSLSTPLRHVTSRYRRFLRHRRCTSSSSRGQRAPARLNWPAARMTAPGQHRIEEKKMSDDAYVTSRQASGLKAWACRPDKRLLAGSMGRTVDCR
ncbi:MAG TPA: hypothetical protein PKA36_17320, partial [Pseudoxanthomonas mexicana]|nr:hypothetical protein [Pseudoxanthomonas mexicana]